MPRAGLEGPLNPDFYGRRISRKRSVCQSSKRSSGMVFDGSESPPRPQYGSARTYGPLANMARPPATAPIPFDSFGLDQITAPVVTEMTEFLSRE